MERHTKPYISTSISLSGKQLTSKHLWSTKTAQHTMSHRDRTPDIEPVAESQWYLEHTLPAIRYHARQTGKTGHYKRENYDWND